MRSVVSQVQLEAERFSIGKTLGLGLDKVKGTTLR